MVVLLPGALSSVESFGPARGWTDADTLVIEYRMPGLDGRPAWPALDIEGAGAEVAAIAERYPDATVHLLGVSTGAAVALEAASRMPGREVEVAAVSAALPSPGIALSAVGSGLDIAAAAARAGTVARAEVWRSYYRDLLFGPAWRTSPALRARAEIITAQQIALARQSARGLGARHAGDLLFWTLPPAEALAHARIRFHHGANDPVIPAARVARLAQRVSAEIELYVPDGHLLFVTRPEVLDAIRADFGL